MWKCYTSQQCISLEEANVFSRSISVGAVGNFKKKKHQRNKPTKMVLILEFYNCKNSASRRCSGENTYMCAYVYKYMYISGALKQWIWNGQCERWMKNI